MEKQLYRLRQSNRRGSPLRRPTLERLSGFCYQLPERMEVHPHAGCERNSARYLLIELGANGSQFQMGILESRGP